MRRPVRSEQFGNPAAGAGFSIVLATNQAAKLRSLMFTLTTDITVANRQVAVSLADQNGLVVFQTFASAVQAASAVVTYEVSDNFAVPGAVGGLQYMGWPDIWLPPNWSVVVAAALEDTGDQFSQIAYAAEWGWTAWEKDELRAEFAQAAQAMMAA